MKVLIRLLFAAVAVTLGVCVPTASFGADCPESINEALRLSEVDGTEDYAPSELPRSFPQLEERLAPGAESHDAVNIRSVAGDEVRATLTVRSGQTPVAAADHDLRVRVRWAGETVLDANYRELDGKRVDLGVLRPDEKKLLRVDVELPWVDRKDNDTQDRSWPLSFRLGVEGAGECGSGSGSAGNSDADETTEAGDDGSSTNDSDAAGERNSSATSATDSAGSRDADVGDSAAHDRAEAAGTKDSSSGGDGSGELPFTGWSGWPLVIGAGVLIAVGLALRRFSSRPGRRRRGPRD